MRGFSMLRHLGRVATGWLAGPELGMVVPRSVLAACNEQKGLLYAKDLRVLHQKGFVDLLIYLLTKALHGDSMMQRIFLREIAQSAVSGSDENIESTLTAVINYLGDEKAVQAAKIFQLNRQGFEMWDRTYRLAAEAQACEGRDVAIVAYAPMLGFRWFVRTCFEQRRHFFVISHLLAVDYSVQYCGYVFSRKDDDIKVENLNRAFSFPRRMTVIEDTVKQGTTLRAVVGFLARMAPYADICEMILDRSSAS